MFMDAMSYQQILPMLAIWLIPATVILLRTHLDIKQKIRRILYASVIVMLLAPMILKTIPTNLVAFLTYSAGMAILVTYTLNHKIKTLTYNISSAALLISTTISLVLAISVIWILLNGSLKFFSEVSLLDFLFGTQWEIEDPNNSKFGVIPLITGSFLISFIALLTALPLGLTTAIYVTFYSGHKTKIIINFVLEIFGGLPAVVHGYFGITIISVVIGYITSLFNIRISHENALVTGITIGMMILPTIAILTTSSIAKHTKKMYKASMALGATKSETIKFIIMPAASKDIINATLLALSRSMGETTIMMMLAGNIPTITLNPLQPVASVTTQIASLIRSDQEFNSVYTMSSYALGLILLLITLAINYTIHNNSSKNK